MTIETDTKLPNSWILTTISEIAEYVQRGKSPKYTDWSELPVINQKCIRWHGIDSEYLKFIHPEQWEKWSEERFLQEGDILWNSTGTGTIGRAAIFQGLPEYKKAVVDSHVTIVRTKNYNQKLLQYWIMSPAIQFKIDGMYTGSTNQVELSKTEVLSTSLPLPPLNEQKRIVAKIEALQTRSTAVKEELEAIKPLLNQFRQSVLASAFRGDLTKDWREQNPDVENYKIIKLKSPVIIGESEETLPNTWKWSLLTEIAKLESGHTPRKSVPEYWEGGDVPWICLKDIRAVHGKIIENTLHMPTMLGIENSSARLLPKDTVCFSRDISVGFVTIMGRSMATTQHFANWICGNQLLNKYLMYAFMASRYFLIQSGEGTTVRTIYMPALKKMRVVLAPLEEQKEIVRRIESLFKLADNIEQQYQQAEINLETLNQSILAEAFRGELVSQDPNDEPASVLLERIREERDKAKATPKKSKTKKKRSANKKDEQLGIPGM